MGGLSSLLMVFLIRHSLPFNQQRAKEYHQDIEIAKQEIFNLEIDISQSIQQNNQIISDKIDSRLSKVKKSFKKLEKSSGKKFDVDLFASDSNSKCVRFYSSLASDKAEGRNAFKFDWKSLGNVFACPPPHLMGQVIRQFIGNKARGGIIIPAWKSNLSLIHI